MTTSPELEAVARAICRQNLISTKQPDDTATIDAYWKSFIPGARAALLASRPPTDAMLEAMDEVHPTSRHKAFELAIDHILGDAP